MAAKAPSTPLSAKRIGRPPRNGGTEDTGGIRDALLVAATAEFARNGFAGARIGGRNTHYCPHCQH